MEKNAFDKVIGYEAIKEELIRYADVLRNRERYSKLGITLPAGILLSGKPGLGKTLMAKCFIKESGCKSFVLRKEKPNGDFVRKIRETYEKAKNNTPCIVFLDDMDKFANEDDMHRDAEEYVTIQTCIDDFKEYGVFTIATVNEKYCLPDSLLRPGRFDESIDIEMPEEDDARSIIEYYLSEKKNVGNIDLEEISKVLCGKSCAELENIINKAGFYAAYDRKKLIEQNDIIKACLRVEFESPESINPKNDEFTRKVAIHEAGHAVIHEILEPNSVSLVTVCRYVGCPEGVTRLSYPKKNVLSKKSRENQIIGALGGKAAVELVMGEADMGCNSDMYKAYDLTAMLVDNVCALGFETFERANASGYLLEKKDRLIASEIERYYTIAKRVIFENRIFLDAIVDALVDHHTITYREMQMIRGKYVQKNVHTSSLIGI